MFIGRTDADQSIGRTDAEVETPILWPPDGKSQLIGKILMLAKDVIVR